MLFPDSEEIGISLPGWSTGRNLYPQCAWRVSVRATDR